MATVLDGKAVAAAIRKDVSARVQRLLESGSAPCLATVRVGDSPDDAAYERSIVKAAEKLGIECRTLVLPVNASQQDLMSEVERINSDAAIDGCMLFRPLPKGIDEAAVCNALDAGKDVDGAGAASLAGVFMGIDEGFAPATAEACIAILDHYGIALEGRHVVVVGRSLVIGKPVGMIALSRNATVTYCHSRTADLSSIVRQSDIAICAVGKAGFFGAECFEPGKGQVVIDVGMNVDSEGRLCGDVAFDDAEPAVDAITPVPGGVGAVTTAILLEHVTSSAERSRTCQ